VHPPLISTAAAAVKITFQAGQVLYVISNGLICYIIHQHHLLLMAVVHLSGNANPYCHIGGEAVCEQVDHGASESTQVSVLYVQVCLITGK